MAKSFRLDAELERRLERAAAHEGVSASVLIRDAIRRRVDEVLGDNLVQQLGDVVGSVEIGGKQSRRTGEAFSKLLQMQSKRRRK